MRSTADKLFTFPKILAVFLVFFGFTLIFSGISTQKARANEDCEAKYKCEKEDDADEKMACYNKKTACLEKVLGVISNEKNTLTNTISVLNGQINLQQVQINQLLAEINTLEREISELTERINGLGVSLDRLSTMLVNRVKAQYKRTQTNPLSLLLESDSFNSFVTQYKYLAKAGEQTAYAMTRAESQRLHFDEQKSLKEVKQDEVLEKRQQLEGKRQELAASKQEQEAILNVTKSNETRYQELLAQARKELAQISGAANVVIREGNEVKVKRGETIGTMGNSGFSTGAHLHFSIYRYNVKQFQNTGSWGWYYSNHINPLDKLKSKTVTWSTGCGHDPSGSTSSGKGSWDWPMSDVRITQNYGSNTCYNWMYGGNTHPALDMVGMSSHSVKAVQDGEAYFCRNCLGDGGNGVFIFHDDNYMSVYWHLK